MATTVAVTQMEWEVPNVQVVSAGGVQEVTLECAVVRSGGVNQMQVTITPELHFKEHPYTNSDYVDIPNVVTAIHTAALTTDKVELTKSAIGSLRLLKEIIEVKGIEKKDGFRIVSK